MKYFFSVVPNVYDGIIKDHYPLNDRKKLLGCSISVKVDNSEARKMALLAFKPVTLPWMLRSTGFI